MRLKIEFSIVSFFFFIIFIDRSRTNLSSSLTFAFFGPLTPARPSIRPPVFEFLFFLRRSLNEKEMESTRALLISDGAGGAAADPRHGHHRRSEPGDATTTASPRTTARRLLSSRRCPAVPSTCKKIATASTSTVRKKEIIY